MEAKRSPGRTLSTTSCPKEWWGNADKDKIDDDDDGSDDVNGADNDADHDDF